MARLSILARDEMFTVTLAENTEPHHLRTLDGRHSGAKVVDAAVGCDLVSSPSLSPARESRACADAHDRFVARLSENQSRNAEVGERGLHKPASRAPSHFSVSHRPDLR